MLRPRATDAALALVLFAVAQSEVWLRWSDGGDGTPGGTRVASALVLSLPTLAVAWRRRYPVAVEAAIAAGIVLHVTLVAAYAPFVPLLLPLAIGNYSCAVHGRPRLRLAGLAAAIAAAGAIALRIPSARSTGELLFTAFALAGTWFVGDLVRQRERRVLHVEMSRDAWTRAALASERTRIARELHDVVAHSVSLMGVQAGAARMLLDDDPQRARETLQSIEETARQSVAELQRLLPLLRDEGDAALLPQPGLGDLAALAESLRAAGVDVRLRSDVPADVPAGPALAAYRIVQEALTNVLKHARARSADVRLAVRGETLELEISDDGDGPSGGAVRGHGLIGMGERAALYGGSFETAAGDGRGFVVRARLPLRRDGA